MVQQLRFGFAFLVCLAATAVMAHPSNKWRLEFSGGSHSAGEIVFEFRPKGADAFRVTVSVPDDKSENAVAKHVTKELKKKLPSDAYHVERDDGEDVLVKKRHGAANFDLQIVFNSVKHVRVHADRE